MKATVILFIVGLLLPASSVAQRGTGESTGMASEATRPATFDVEGTIASVKIAPCELTTGRSLMGAHVFLSRATGDTLNVHLGPDAELVELVSHLHPGKALTATVFTTDRLPANAVVATTVDVDGETYVLRDATLRPTWAGDRSGFDGRPRRGRGGRSN